MNGVWLLLLTSSQRALEICWETSHVIQWVQKWTTSKWIIIGNGQLLGSMNPIRCYANHQSQLTVKNSRSLAVINAMRYLHHLSHHVVNKRTIFLPKSLNRFLANMVIAFEFLCEGNVRCDCSNVWYAVYLVNCNLPYLVSVVMPTMFGEYTII